ncbi:MAG TPA: ribonuclease P protein component [Blastocatellia bacterium]|nr:ribonuclease P protein component [Blastocatellia bacterium]
MDLPAGQSTGKDESFPKSSRILKREVFRKVYENGKKFQAKYFTAFTLFNQENNDPRIGITVTRRVGKSVQRNRCRRLVREVFRKNKWRVPHGVDIVINVKTALLNAGYQELESDFIGFLERSK